MNISDLVKGGSGKLTEAEKERLFGKAKTLEEVLRDNIRVLEKKVKNECCYQK